MHFVTILYALGLLLLFFSCVFIPPLILSLWEGIVFTQPFIIALLLTAGTGLLLFASCRWIGGKKLSDLDRHDGFLLTVLFWLVPGIFAVLPFYFSPALALELSDAFFEAQSGLTTTGATILSNLDTLPNSLLLYRSLLQWIGGIGLVIAALVLLPLLQIGGMQIYQAQASSDFGSNKFKPRIAETARLLLFFYCSITVLCGLGYYLAGMNGFDAVCHSLSTVSIGGFSTHDNSFGYFSDHPAILIVAMFFMVIAGINFSLHFYALPQGLKGSSIYFRDAECRFYFLLLLLAIALCLIVSWSFNISDDIATTIAVIFQAVAITTTTGFINQDFNNQWPQFLPPMLFAFAFIGACAGSAGGGIKVLRMLLIVKEGQRELKLLVHPHAVIPIKINHISVPERVVRGVWSFFSLYMVTFVILLMALLVFIPDFSSAFYAVVATLNNLGPGLGQLSHNYQNIPDGAKWLLSVSMLLGRLELMALLVLLTPSFWRR